MSRKSRKSQLAEQERKRALLTREYPPINTLQKATTEEVEFYMVNAAAFVASTNFYHSCTDIARIVVAEYMASLDGKTLRGNSGASA